MHHMLCAALLQMYTEASRKLPNTVRTSYLGHSVGTFLHVRKFCIIVLCPTDFLSQCSGLSDGGNVMNLLCSLSVTAYRATDGGRGRVSLGGSQDQLFWTVSLVASLLLPSLKTFKLK